MVGVLCEGLEDQTVALLTAIGGSFFEGKMLLPCTIMMNNMESKRKRARKNQDTDLRGLTHMMNNMESKRERARENQDTDLRGSAMCLRPQEYAYISIYDLGLQHNIFITKPHCTDRYEKPQNTMSRCSAN